MLFDKPLNSILGQLSKVKILRFLTISQAELSGTRIAKAVGISHVKSNIALQELEKHGLIIMRRIGSACLYKLDEENITYKKLLRPLFEKEKKLLNDLKKSITNELQPPYPLSIVLFGSQNQGTPRPDSDIDILIMIPQNKRMADIKKETENASDKVLKNFGNSLSCIVIKEHSLYKKIKGNKRLYVNIVNNGTTIYGKSIKEIINDQKRNKNKKSST